MIDFLSSGPDDAAATLLLAHGAGAGMESPFMAQMAALLAERGVRTLRFEFGYMAARRDGKRKPPPRAQLLSGEYKSAVAAALDLTPRPRRLFIGGKSMGGRVASFVADELFQAEAINGLVCIGYPFHPPKKPDQLRTDHLVIMGCPALIVQGVRDPFGTREEVESYPLSAAIRYHWADDGDHDLGPRGASGFTRKGNLAVAADAIAAFVGT
ncbi:MAG: alpha/beta family hydrolase [Hyphomicrobiaceae bacterium]